MTCLCTEYEVHTKMVQEQCLQLKMKFLLGYNLKIYFLVEEMNLWQGQSSWVEISKFWLVEDSPHPPSKENPSNCSSEIFSKAVFSFSSMFNHLCGRELYVAWIGSFTSFIHFSLKIACQLALIQPDILIQLNPQIAILLIAMV